MLLFIVVFGALIAALVMWDGISPVTQEVLRGLEPRPSEEFTPAPMTPGLPETVAIGPLRWTLVSDAHNFRVSREFQTPVLAGQMRYYPPVLHLSCYGAAAYAWLDTPLRTSGDPGRGDAIAVRLNGGPREFWTRGPRNILIAPSPERLIRALAIGPVLTLDLSFDEAPAQTLRLGTDGFGLYQHKMAACLGGHL